MSKTGSSVTEFDWMTESILMELRSMDGTGTTTDLKERVGVENGDKLLYRFREKLEPAGFIETEQRPAEPGQTPPKIIHLTSRGEGLADQLLDAGDSDDLSISTEVEQLRAEVNKLNSKLDEQGGQAGGSDSDELAEVFDKLDSLSREGDGSWTAQSLAEEIHALRQGMYGMRDYLLENTEMTGDELEDHIQQWMNQK